MRLTPIEWISGAAAPCGQRTKSVAHEFDGKSYAQASTHQREWGTRLIEELHLQGSESILDLGCGDGAITAKLAELLPNGLVVGVDASRGMIDAAIPKTRTNLQFVLMDIDDLEFSDEFDVIFSNATLHWVKDHRRLYHRVGKALLDKGRIRFNFAGDGNCSNYFRVVREAMTQEPFSAWFADFQWPWYMPWIDEYAALVRTTGLSAVRVWGENSDRFFADTDAMVRWIDQPSLVPLLPCLPDSLKDSFREFVVIRMLEETMQPDGRCFETFRRINVYAEKP
jgi:trans-aconitate methyltransferase